MQIFYDERMDVGTGGGDFDVFIKVRLLKASIDRQGIPVTWCAVTPVAWSDWERFSMTIIMSPRYATATLWSMRPHRYHQLSPMPLTLFRS